MLFWSKLNWTKTNFKGRHIPVLWFFWYIYFIKNLNKKHALFNYIDLFIVNANCLYIPPIHHTMCVHLRKYSKKKFRDNSRSSTIFTQKLGHFFQQTSNIDWCVQLSMSPSIFIINMICANIVVVVNGASTLNVFFSIEINAEHECYQFSIIKLY